jgi:outer membrane protein OmpA-like peptidoglycan-associated protein
VSAATAPILMPTDLLFEYDSASLRPEATQALEKLGTLLTRNPAARFRIEGHTDSFGAEDYNLALSLRRAEAVKQWLTGARGIDPGRITTRGLGKARLLVPASESVEGQRLNRRVEIIITEG